MASEIRVNKINSRTGVGTITLSPTGVDFTGIATVATLKATTGIVTTLSVTGTTTLNDNLDLQDNDKILIGTGDDLEIYHNGTDSFIVDGSRHLLVRAGGSGDLYLQSDSKVLLTDVGGNETFIECNDDSDVKLFHNNNEKFATTGVGASVTGTFNVGTGTSITSSSLIVNDVQYPTAGSLSNRNLIINGAMQVAQRGTVVNAGNEYGGPDRFRFAKNDGAWTISQSTDVPSGQGFSNSWKADCTSVSGTAGLNSVIFQQRFEGRNLQQIKKGSSSAESLTVQFWIKSSKTGTYIAELYDHDNTRQISKSYTISSADTWEHKTITFPGDTSGALDNDNALSLEINLWLFAGSSYTSGTLSTTWTSVTNANRAVGQVNAGDNTANNIYITGVQLEVGEKATPFEHRSFGDELVKCERYFQTYGPVFGFIFSNYTATTSYGALHLRAAMRHAPTAYHLEAYDSSHLNYYSGGGAGKTLTSFGLNQGQPHMCQFVVGGTLGNQGDAAHLDINQSDAIQLQAEL